MAKSIVTFSCLKSTDGVLLAKEIADEVQKSVLVTSLEMLTIVENKSYDCFYIFVTSHDELNFSELLKYSHIKNTLVKMGLTDTVNCGSSEEGSFINVSNILSNFNLRYLRLDDDLVVGEVFDIAYKQSFDTSLTFNLSQNLIVMQYLRYIQSQMLDNRFTVTELVTRLSSIDYHVATSNQELEQKIVFIEGLRSVLYLDCIGINQSVNLINKIKLL